MKVLTLGSFDLLHPGHIGLITWCHRLAGPHGQVIIAVNTDDFMARFKRPPIMTLEERLIQVQAIRHVTQVHPNDGNNQPDLIDTIHPDLIVIGSDWARRDYLTQLHIDQDWLDTRNIALTYVPRTGNWATTELRTRLTNQAF